MAQAGKIHGHIHGRVSVLNLDDRSNERGLLLGKTLKTISLMSIVLLSDVGLYICIIHNFKSLFCVIQGRPDDH